MLTWVLLGGAVGLPLSPPFVALNSTVGYALLADATTNRASFDQTSIHLVSQIDESSCYRASATVVLNALSAHGVQAPVDQRYAPYPMWTQSSFVAQPCVSSNCTMDPHGCRGATLSLAASALSCVAGVDAVALHAGDTGLASPADFSSLLRRLVPGTHVIANFNGHPIDLQHGGHFSPVVAYHPARDLALVLDVSRYKYPPWWAPVPTLWRGIDTFDAFAGRKRGLIVVAASQQMNATP